MTNWRMAGLAATMLAGAPASATVIYDFSSFAGSFVYASDDYIASGRSIQAVDLASCVSTQGSCGSVYFDPASPPFADRLSFAFTVPGGGQTTYRSTFDFGDGAFRTAGNWSSSNGATLKISGAVPEPVTWCTMLAGMGLVGAVLRRRRTHAMA